MSIIFKKYKEENRQKIIKFIKTTIKESKFLQEKTNKELFKNDLINKLDNKKLEHLYNYICNYFENSLIVMKWD